MPYGEYLLVDIGSAAGLVASESRDGSLGKDIGEYLVDVGMVLVDICGEEPSGIHHVAVMREGEWTFGSGPCCEVQVFHVDFFVIDITGEGEVDTLWCADMA